MYVWVAESTANTPPIHNTLPPLGRDETPAVAELLDPETARGLRDLAPHAAEPVAEVGAPAPRRRRTRRRGGHPRQPQQEGRQHRTAHPPLCHDGSPFPAARFRAARMRQFPRRLWAKIHWVIGLTPASHGTCAPTSMPLEQTRSTTKPASA